MKIKIIIPIYAYEGVTDFRCPEAYNTPTQQVQWLKAIVNEKSIMSQDELIIVTTSIYIAKGLCNFTIKKGDNFGEKCEAVFSDGKNEITREEFFRHFSEPMILLIDEINP